MNDPETAGSERETSESREILRVGFALLLDLTTREARFRDRQAKLTPTDAALLASFMRDPDRVWSQQELLQEHWQGLTDRDNLYHRVRDLRRALGKDLIRTVHGVGYQLGTRTVGKGRARPVMLQSGELRLHVGRQLSHGDRGPAQLTPRDARLIECVMRRAGGLATDEEMMRAGGIEAGNNVRYRESMSKLRHKLQALEADHLLVYVEGGYRLAGTAGLRRIAGLELDLGARAARLHGRPLELWPTWLALLERLAVAPGQSVPRAELVAHAWGVDPPSESLGSIIAQLQRALGPTGPRLIVSAGDGYRLAIEDFGLLAVGPLLLDPVARYARLDDREEQLAPTESLVLEVLMRAPGHAIARAQLLTAARLEEPRALEARLATLRPKLRRLAGSHGDTELIVYVAGIGHRLGVELLDVGQLDWPLQFAGLQFRPRTGQLRHGKLVGTVAAKPAVMLELLVQAKGDVVADATLIHAIWGKTPGRAALPNCERTLQRALDKVGSAVTVKRVRGTGYRLLTTEP